MAHDTIIRRFFEHGQMRPDRPAYYAKSGSGWQMTTWREYNDQVRQAGKALLALGLKKGSTVGILSFNRPEWVIADLACMAIGGAPAGIYTTSSPPEVQYILHHAESKVAFVENEEQWKKIDTERKNLPKLKHVVTMRGVPDIEDPLVLSWEAFLARGDSVDDTTFDNAWKALEPGGLATLIYTSGTTGPPKGVMLSHENLAWTAQCIADLVESNDEDVSLSYLPLSHIAEQLVTIHGPATTGASVYFAESIDKVADNIKDARPTIFFGVPRIWEKFYAGIGAKLADATGAKAKLVAWARDVATRMNQRRGRGETPGGLLASRLAAWDQTAQSALPAPARDVYRSVRERVTQSFPVAPTDGLSLQYALAHKLVFSKLRKTLGLDRARVFVSGAAPISKEILEFFASLDIVVQEIYGQSEDCGPTSFNLGNRFQFGSVGLPLPGVQVKVADDGEILVKGKNVFLGYFKDKKATDETLKDGWLHSGDLGRFDADGFLHITGRKKDIIITAGGKNIAPKNIEAALKNHELIAEAVVIGDRRKFLSVLLCLDEEAARKLAQSNGANGKPLGEIPVIRDAVQRAVDDVNRDLAQVEKIKKLTILPRSLTIEDGELTPTLKVKRNVVARNWSAAIEAMYAEAPAKTTAPRARP